MNKKELNELSRLKGQQAVDFFSSLKLTKGKFHGVYFEPLDWQQKIIRDIYGTLKPDGTRQYKEAWIEIPKKNGKSEMVAGFALKQLCADGEMMGEVYGCAADKQQASIVFDVAVEMVEQEPSLKKRMQLILSKKRIVYLPTKSFYQVVSAEAYTKHGLNISGCVFDEIHAQPNRALFDVMTFGSGDAREQPLFVYITTAGDDPDRVSIGWELHEKAEGILLGIRNDPTFYPVIFGIDEENKRIWRGWDYLQLPETEDKNYWKDPKIISIVNPSVGNIIKLDTVQESLQKVQGNEADERIFKQLRMNIWVKYKASKWLPQSTWEQNGGLVPYDRDNETGLIIPKSLIHRKCYGGLDLSSKMDLSAFVLVFPPEDPDGKYIILPHFWLPEDNMAERIKNGLKYDVWGNQGLIRLTSGNRIDYRYIEKDILRMADFFDIHEIGYDPWNAYDVEPTLSENGLTMVEIRQNFQNIGPAMDETESLLTGNHFNHGNNPVMNWMYGNLEVITNPEGFKKPTKANRTANSSNKRGYTFNKIDGIVALLIAMCRVIVQDKGPREVGITIL